MGVQGLWTLLESSSETVPIHTLRGKVLAIDVSIWLHQAVKGFRDKDGNPLPNAHLLGVFHRICKLLNYGIKPVFVFDGGVPVLKRQTMNARRQKKIEAKDKSEEVRTKLLTNLVRQQVQHQMKRSLPPTQQMESMLESLSPKKKSVSPRKRGNQSDSEDDEFAKLRKIIEAKGVTLGPSSSAPLSDPRSAPNSTEDSAESSYSDSDEIDCRGGRNYSEHFSSITSPNFDTLPLELQHEILFEMQESKKTNSWGKMHEMPKDLQNFSSFQMDRLVKRRFLQKKIQSVQQEMGERHIHVQNLDDLAMFEAEFGSTGEKQIIGSKEGGAILIKSKHPSELKPEGNSTTAKGQVHEVITIDDYVQDWESEEESVVDEVPGPSRNVVASTSAQMSTSRQVQQGKVSEEEDDIRLAIALSLSENCVEAMSSEGAEQETLKENDTKQKTVDNQAEFSQKSPTKNSSKGSTPVRSVQHEPKFFTSDFQKGNNSCFKFLGWVGFNENMSAAKNHSSQNTKSITNSADSSDCSDDSGDFEEVQENEREVLELNSINVNTVPHVTAAAINDMPSPSDHIAKPSIVIKFEQNFNFKKEDDLFSDVFKDTELSVDSTVENLNEISSPKVSQHDDPEMEGAKSDESDSEFLDVQEKVESEDFQEFPSPPPYSPQPASLHKDPDAEQRKITRTLGTMPSQSHSGVRMISAEFMQSQQKLVDTQIELRSERGGQERIAASITDQMYIEAQELLALFGIPFVVSPMEAESQCAFLDSACLTDGTITDDSDIWLFGGQRVYKNFFTQGDKPVQFFQYSDIVQHLHLDREKLVLMAILTGSDYTLGVDGVGRVLALEILAEFPSASINAFDSLLNFREWWDLSQTAFVEPSNKIKAKLQKLHLRPGFPSKHVYDAYMDPTVDSSTELFRWGTPDLESIKAYTKRKFGWDETKCDSTIGPILKNWNTYQNQKQTTLDRFLAIPKDLPTTGRAQKVNIKSKRLALAMAKLNKEMPPEEVNLSSDSESESSNPAQTSNSSKRKSNHSTHNAKSAKISKRGTLESMDSASGFTGIFTSSSKPTPEIPQKTQAQQRNNLLKTKAAEVLKKKSK